MDGVQGMHGKGKVTGKQHVPCVCLRREAQGGAVNERCSHAAAARCCLPLPCPCLCLTWIMNASARLLQRLTRGLDASETCSKSGTFVSPSSHCFSHSLKPPEPHKDQQATYPPATPHPGPAPFCPFHLTPLPIVHTGLLGDTLGTDASNTRSRSGTFLSRSSHCFTHSLNPLTPHTLNPLSPHSLNPLPPHTLNPLTHTPHS